MKSREKAAALVSRFDNNFRCPICKYPMKVIDLRSMVCSNNHTFDFAKQGYINLLHRAVKSQYDKGLFQARHEMIIKSDLYGALHEQISEMIRESVEESRKNHLVLDAGSGEGSHLQRILEMNGSPSLTGIGMDISKEGIRLAASNYRNITWFVGDLANIPIENHTLKVILNILSPANYQEFKRTLAQDGIVLKVVPGQDYLKELRRVLFDQTERASYKNDETVALFNTHFRSVNIKSVKYKQQLSQTELKHLLEMSPLSWNMEADVRNRFGHMNRFETTIDLDILIGKDARMKGEGI